MHLPDRRREKTLAKHCPADRGEIPQGWNKLIAIRGYRPLGGPQVTGYGAGYKFTEGALGTLRTKGTIMLTERQKNQTVVFALVIAIGLCAIAASIWADSAFKEANELNSQLQNEIAEFRRER